MTSNETSWLFPPALNTTFREAFVEGYTPANDTTGDHGVYAILLAAVQDLTPEQRVDSGFQNQGWGSESAIVRVGDTIVGEFNNEQLREYGLNCILCKKGSDHGSIENACDNYTDFSNVVSYTKRYGPYPSPGVDVFPSLDQYSSVPKETCGLCIFTIFGTEDLPVLNDYSVPFPVLQDPGTTREVFNRTSPTGVVVAPRSTPTWDPYNNPSSLSAPQKHEKDSSNNTGLIVGVVVGVLFVASCIMGIVIFIWTRRHRKKDVINPYSHSHHAARQPEHEPASVALQRVRSVVRRPESSASGEVPPPYHEAVRAKEAEP